MLREVRDGAAKETAHSNSKSPLQGITMAEMLALFNYLTDVDGSGGGGAERRLLKAQFIAAITRGGREHGVPQVSQGKGGVLILLDLPVQKYRY